MKECSEDHQECLKEPSLLPTRILDAGAEGDVIRLVDGLHRTGLYVCLSYCVSSLSSYIFLLTLTAGLPNVFLLWKQWGQTNAFTTSIATLEARRTGFRLSEAPKTFVDAITITRHLGLRFIWIDSLCICQDDAQDWARESARMCDVYSNAHLVIAANRAPDSNGGCFHVREPRPKSVIDLPGQNHQVHATLLYPSDQHASFKSQDRFDEPLSQRGWQVNYVFLFHPFKLAQISR